MTEISDELCHCGRPIHFYDDGYTRHMCEDCSSVRCDLADVRCPVLHPAPARDVPETPDLYSPTIPIGWTVQTGPAPGDGQRDALRRLRSLRDKVKVAPVPYWTEHNYPVREVKADVVAELDAVLAALTPGVPETPGLLDTGIPVDGGLVPTGGGLASSPDTPKPRKLRPGEEGASVSDRVAWLVRDYTSGAITVTGPEIIDRLIEILRDDNAARS